MSSRQVAPALFVLAMMAVPVVMAQRQAPAGRPASQTVDAARTFLDTLEPAQRTTVSLPLTTRTRVVWSNLPTGVPMQVGATERNGLKFANMNPRQQEAALALLASLLSRDGYQKVVAIVDADQHLEETSAPSRPATAPVRFGRGEFYIAILGEPAAAGRWMVQFGGHHLAINVTIVAGASVLTPSHTGAQPAVYQMNGETRRPLGRENDKAFALIGALDPERQKKAVLSYQVRNLVLGPGEDGKVIQPEGLKASEMTAPQRAQLLAVIGEWVNILNDDAAAGKMKEVESNLADTYFAWAGSTTNGKEAYFRIQGPTVLIEYAPQGLNGSPSVEHIHTIYRDPANDYAAKLKP